MLATWICGFVVGDSLVGLTLVLEIRTTENEAGEMLLPAGHRRTGR
jgi:hypothetical protein